VVAANFALATSAPQWIKALTQFRLPRCACRTLRLPDHEQGIWEEMLELLRKAAKTWVAKALLILLVGSFGVWGVHSSMFASSSDSVVTVGDQKVSNSEYQIAFNSALNGMSQQFGTRLTVEQAKMFGIENNVVGQLMSGAALDQLASNMKLGLSQDRLLMLIQTDPAFQDETGGFSRQLMEQRLNGARIRVDDYISLKTKEAIRTQIADALAKDFEPPKTLIDALQSYADERRDISYLMLTKANIEAVKPPADNVLATWFAANKNKYQAPEFRKVTYVKLEPSDIADASTVTDAQIKADYDKRKDTYRTPATRTIEQLTFADKATADAAAGKLAAGSTFDRLVTEQGKTPTDVLLGDFTEDKLPNAAMGKAAFAVAKDGGVTAVVSGLVGPVIMRVTNIRPEVVKPLDSVKDDIRKQLALVQANDDIQSVYDRFEDDRASGSTLPDVAKKLQLKSVVLDGVDASGHDLKNNEIKDLPGNLVSEVFKTEEGVEPLPIQLDDGGYVWFEIGGITPAHDRKIDEVKAKVIADWTAEQEKLALAKKAEEVTKQISGGAKVEDVATNLKLAVETKNDLKRGLTDEVLGSAAIGAAFGGPDGYVTHAAGGDGQIVLKVTDVRNTPQTDALDTTTNDNKRIAAGAGEDIFSGMVSELEAEYGARFNRQLANQLMVR
jgi:peptidyl-prolyl cis-trans isomerase D